MKNDIFDKAFTPDELLKAYKTLKTLIDGEEVGINPLKEIPKPKITLYGIDNLFIGKYFDTQEELEQYLLTEDAIKGRICTLEYLGSVAGKEDVIKKIYENESLLYVAVDEDGYGIYNEDRSTYTGKYIWEYNYGNLRNEYEALKKRGFLLKNDVYGRFDSFYEKVKKISEIHKKRFKNKN